MFFYHFYQNKRNHRYLILTDVKELKDDTLEKDNGGFGIEMVECIVLKAGECIKNTIYKIKVKYDYRIPVDELQSIEVELIFIVNGETTEAVIASKNPILDKDYFAGNNAW